MDTPGTEKELQPEANRDTSSIELEYVEYYKQIHEDPSAYPGKTILKWVDHLQRFFDPHKLFSGYVLDYGCGKAKYYTDAPPPGKSDIRPWARKLTKLDFYDPAVPGKDVLSRSVYDLVLCVDVLEHIPSAALPNVLENIFIRAAEGAFITVCNRAALVNLPNGENAHCTCMGDEDWFDLIEGFARRFVMSTTRTGFTLFIGVQPSMAYRVVRLPDK